MKIISFDLDSHTAYKEGLEKIRLRNHWSVKKICKKIPLNYRTYKKLTTLDPQSNLSFYSLKKIKRFILKNL
jgi:hypothetical protein